MSEIQLEKFTPNDATREIFKTLKVRAEIIDQFFTFWESQLAGRNSVDAPDAAREAASVVAEAYLTSIALVAVMGSVFAGREPNRETWKARCLEDFDRAMVEVCAATAEAEGKPRAELTTRTDTVV